MPQDSRDAQVALIERLRGVLADQSPLRETSMFGTRAFMVNDKIVVCALKGGSLLVRVPADRHDELLARPGAAQAEMGAGRDMGPGWIEVAAAALEAEEALVSWVRLALAHNRAVT